MAGIAERQSRERQGLDGPSVSLSSWDHSPHSSSSLGDDYDRSLQKDEDPHRTASHPSLSTASFFPKASRKTLYLDMVTTATLLKLHEDEGIRRQVWRAVREVWTHLLNHFF